MSCIDRRRQAGCRITYLLLCALSSLAIAPLAVARSAPDGLADTVQPAHGQSAHIPSAHIQSEPLRRGHAPPQSLRRIEHYYDYDTGRPDPRARYLDPQPPAQQVAKGDCDLALFETASGSTLVAAIRAVAPECLYGLFGVEGSAAASTFAEAKMITVANAFGAAAPGYAGDNRDGSLQLILFLRAGLFVQFYQSDVVGDYGAGWRSAIQAALNGFVANPHFANVSDEHGAVLSEFVTLIDSAGENAAHLTTVRGLLDAYGPGHAEYWYMKAAVNNCFTVLFRGHYGDEFRAQVASAGPAITDSLLDFILRNRQADVASEREYLLSNAGAELARFLQYSEPFVSTLRPKVKQVLDQFALLGPGAGIYVRTADITDYYDHANCAYYGLCNFLADLEATVLPPANARDCSSSLRVRSQALSSQQLDLVCSIVGGEAAYFHAETQTGGLPVANDFNTRLEMVIFHSSDDYATYSGVLFGNNTNNGGIYLEGDPSNLSNQARFLAYEAEWLRPAFEVWNLTHEYIHYLDGRYNWYGRFADYPLDAPASAVWIIEGLAEYLSYGYRQQLYQGAISEAANPDRYSLDQLFDTEYGHSSARVYRWGYLGSRYLMEQQRAQIAALHALTRVGDYSSGYSGWLNAQRGLHNTAFRNWVACFGAHQGDVSSCGVGGGQVFANGFETPQVRRD
ncbi:collagenase [Pseudomarimonas arenosa]|uniref:microbial collagenase n=1 Tax=Pseudomarimonas arenosa TaxID=2774145 RepID=A0AAW3ZL92_9GAMM|nr:collagenase [Pseudomarimonas arenosa]MBD8525081.1 collagenase [Pseudomarimonas arenosa]